MIEDVSAPAEPYDLVELYDTVHRLLLERTGGAFDGRLVHLTWPAADGLRVIGVWESREQLERATREVVGPVLAEVLQGQGPPVSVVTEFEVRGLVLSRAGIAV